MFSLSCKYVNCLKRGGILPNFVFCFNVFPFYMIFMLVIYITLLFFLLHISLVQENNRDDQPEPVSESPSTPVHVSVSPTLNETHNEVRRWPRVSTMRNRESEQQSLMGMCA